MKKKYQMLVDCCCCGKHKEMHVGESGVRHITRSQTIYGCGMYTFSIQLKFSRPVCNDCMERTLKAAVHEICCEIGTAKDVS